MTVAPIPISMAGERLSLQEGKGNSMFVYILTGISAIGGFLFGYDTGVVSGAMVIIRKQMDLDNVWHELIVSITVGAAGICALFAGSVSDYFGRKPAILMASFTFSVGAVVMGVANSKEILLVGRAVVGAGIGMVSTAVPIYIAEASPISLRGKLVSFFIFMVAGGQFFGTLMAGTFSNDPFNGWRSVSFGIASCIVPMYIAEVAPASSRGKLVSVNQMFITLGQFVASILCGAFSYVETDGWRYMLGLSGVPAVLQFIGFLGMPESPRWLVSKGHVDRARTTLRGIRGQDADIDAELDSVIESCRETDEARQMAGDHSAIYSILTTWSVARALILGCSLQIFQQLAGINTVMYYSAAIIKMAGVEDDKQAIWLAAATAFINFICTFIGLYLVEKIGRKPLLLGSMIGVILSLLVLGGGFQLAEVHAPPVDFRDMQINGTECGKYISCASCTNDLNCGFCFVKNSDGSPSNGSCVANDGIDDSWAKTGRCADPSLLTQANASLTATMAANGTSLHFANDWCPTDYTWITLLGLGLYLFSFAPGMGPMPWTINSEIFPLWARGTAFSITTSCNWATNLIVSMTFLTLTEALTKKGAFYLYAGLSTLGFAFFFWVLPETKGTSLEDVEGLFARSWFSCSDKDKPSDKAIQKKDSKVGADNPDAKYIPYDEKL